MSRVRVYELAKEAGMGSKELADKLIAAGYEIKGHSSTVDEETADRIRKTMFKKAGSKATVKAKAKAKTAAKAKPAAKKAAKAKAKVEPQADTAVEAEPETEKVERRIEGEGDQRSTVIRRRKTIIRRRAKAEPAVEEGAVEETPEAKRAESGAAAPVEPVEPEQQAETAETLEQPEAVEADDAVASPGEEPVTENGTEAEPVREEAQLQAGDEPEAEPAAADAEELAEEKTAEIRKPKKVERKKIAKVVGTIELPTQPQQDRTEKQRPKRGSSRPLPRSARGGVATDFQPGPAPESTERGRKKGKRGQVPADENGERRGKGFKKGKKNLKFTHFDTDYQRGGRRGKRGKVKSSSSSAPSTIEMKASKKKITVFDTITVGDLAAKMKVKASEVIGKLMGLGVMATMNQAVDVDTATLIATEFGYEIEQGITEEIGIQLFDAQEEGGEVTTRPPVVTVMGHVDHGKTSILDAIRKTDVAEGEAGGITQHIGAYHVRSKAGDVTFVDTPGHAAFTEMRSRGAQITDLVVLVVAADDGVMDQTREAINHAQAADVPILVAVNKIDKDNADPDRVKRELAELELIPEDWGGQTIYCETSAKQNKGIDELLENIQLMAEILELQADPTRKAKGRVVEARLDKGRGAVATVLVQEGTLRPGDNFVVGQFSGKVRAMLDDKGRQIKKAGPSEPVEVQGLAGVPLAGDEFIVVTDDKMAKNVSQARSMKVRESELAAGSKISLDKLFEQMSEGDVQELRLIIRADVQGTLEAFAKAAEKLSTDEIKVRVLHEGAGTISESDILLASASDAIVIGFNVRPSAKIKEMAEKENVDVRSYDVIYHALDDIRKAMVGMLDPTFEEEVIGTAEIREVFSVPKVGKIAGCAVTHGAVRRNAGVRVLRDGVVVYTGKISSLRRFQDDAKEVVAGYECGIGVENFNDIKVGDNLEAFVMQQVESTLE
jgi:translation initiation factor IF-2